VFPPIGVSPGRTCRPRSIWYEREMDANWWIAFCTGLGLTIVGSFGPSVLPQNLHTPAFWLGIAIMGLAASLWVLKDIFLLQPGAGLYPLILIIMASFTLVGGCIWLWAEREAFKSVVLSPSAKAISSPWTDDLSGWSVTIETSPVVGYSLPGRWVAFQGFRLVNTSKVHTRIIDLEITIPLTSAEPPNLHFTTEYYRQSEYRERFFDRDKEKSRGWDFLESPLVLQPQQMKEGQLDFVLPDNAAAVLARDLNAMRLGAATVKIIDRISGRQLEIVLGEHFSALTGRKFDPRHPDKYGGAAG
jgi:hypothetical protein